MFRFNRTTEDQNTKLNCVCYSLAMSSTEENLPERIETPDDPRGFSNIKGVKTTTDRLILYNSKDARERLSSKLVIPVEP